METLLFIGKLIAARSFGEVWDKLKKYCTPDKLHKAIKHELSTDAKLKDLIEPVPNLNKQRLDESDCRELAKFVFRKNITELAAFIQSEQFVELPSHPVSSVDDFDAVWNRVAHCVEQAFVNAIQSDDDNFRVFVAAAQAELLSLNIAIKESVDEGNVTAKESASKIESIEELLEKISHQPTTVVHNYLIQADFEHPKEFVNQIDKLDDEIRKLLGEEGERRYRNLQEAFQVQNEEAGIQLAAELTEWLTENTSRLPQEINFRLRLILADARLLTLRTATDKDELFNTCGGLINEAESFLGTDPSLDLQSRLVASQAKLMSFQNNDPEALSILEAVQHPRTVKMRLLILIDQGGVEEASLIINSAKVDELWVEHGAFIWARIGSTDDFEKALRWAKRHTDHVRQNLTRVAIARGILNRLCERNAPPSFSALTASAAELEEAGKIVQLVKPIVDISLAKMEVESGVEADALGINYEAERLQQNFERASECALLLKKWSPVHFSYLSAVLRSDVPEDRNLPARIKDDYPNSCDFNIHGLTLSIDYGLNGSVVLEEIRNINDFAKSSRDKAHLARIAFQTLAAAPILQDDGIEIIQNLVGKTHAIYQISIAHQCWKCGNVAEALSLIESVDSTQDTTMLANQLHAQILIKQQDFAKAAEILYQVACQLTEPDSFREAAMLAIQSTPPLYNLVEKACIGLIAIVGPEPESLLLLAEVSVRKKDFANGLEQFRELSKLEPDNPMHIFNLAQCLERLNKPDEALAKYDKLCESENPPADVILARAILLKNLGRAKEAFSSLEEQAEEAWGDPKFVKIYHLIANAADENHQAGMALQRLHELNPSDDSGKPFLKSFSEDEFQDFVFSHHDRTENILSHIVSGKLPWTTVDRILGKTLYQSWRTRTQNNGWQPELSLAYATQGLYSTNGYTAIQKDDESHIVSVSCNPNAREIVIDLSSLLTLHRLGILKQALEYFDRVKLPASYLASVLPDAGKLTPHQKSQETEARTVYEAVEAGKLSILQESATSGEAAEDFLALDYQEQLVSILSELHGRNFIPQSVLQNLYEYVSPSIGQSKSDLIEQPLVVQTTVLESLVHWDLFDDTIKLFPNLVITQEDSQELKAALRQFQFLSETREMHKDLWSTLKRTSNVEWIPAPVDPAKVSAEEKTAQDIDLDTHFLANQLELPLLVDDRTLQAATLNRSRKSPDLAFGTDCLIQTLGESEVLTRKQVADAYLQLIRWNYRFLTLPVDVLLTLEKEFPRSALSHVSAYIHNCMRDPGLFSGLETSSPPMSMAYRFYQDWNRSISVFVASIWLDENRDQEILRERTAWICERMFPSPPESFGAATAFLADSHVRLSLYYVISQLMLIENLDRANLALRTIANSLGTNDEELVFLLGTMIDESGQLQTEQGIPTEIMRETQARMLTLATAHLQDHIPSRMAIIALKNHLVTSLENNPITPELIAILSDPESDRHLSKTTGPLIFYKESEEQQAIELYHLLLNPKSASRSTAISELNRSNSDWQSVGELFLAPKAAGLLSQSAASVNSIDTEIWSTGAIQLADATQDDFFYLLAGFSQSAFQQHFELQHDYLVRILRPTSSMLEFWNECPLRSPRSDLDNLEQIRNRIIAEAQYVEQLCDQYLWYFGHLPLTGTFSLGDVLNSWLVSNSTPNSFGEVILDWAFKSQSPYALYHVLQACFHVPQLTSQLKSLKIWDLVESLKNQKTRFDIRLHLMRHYCRHIELLACYPQGDATVSMASWLADKVAIRIEVTPEQSQKEIGKVMDQIEKWTRQMHDIARPMPTASCLSHACHFRASMWDDALCCEILKCSEFRNLIETEEFRKWLKSATFDFTGIPSIIDDRKIPLFAFEFRRNEAQGIFDSVPEIDCGDFVTEIDTSHPQWFQNLDEKQQSLLFHVLRRNIYTADLPDNLQPLFSNDELIVELLCTARITDLEVFFHSLLISFREKENQDTKCGLPHMLATALEQTNDEKRIEFLINRCFSSAISLNSFSVLERLQNTSEMTGGSNHFVKWQSLLEEMLPAAPQWLRARIRGLKSIREN